MSHLTTDPEVHLADNLFLTREYDVDGTVYTNLRFRLKLFRDVVFSLDGDEPLFHAHAAKFLSGQTDSLEFSYNCGFLHRRDSDYFIEFCGREGGSMSVPLTERETFAIVREVQSTKKTKANL